MPSQTSESDGRNIWGRARERQRMKARFEIRTRVSSLITQQEKTEEPMIHSTQLTPEQAEDLRYLLRKLEAGHSSCFSLNTLVKHHQLLSKQIPIEYISTYKITTLCTSRFGKKHTDLLLGYIESLDSFSIIEYAVWLGEYPVLTSLLAGGIDPTLKGGSKQWQEDQLRALAFNEETSRQCLSARVLELFFSGFPRSLAGYVVKRVVDMRIQDWRERNDSNTENVCCPMCDRHRHHARLNFGSPCHHSFCENCLWENLLQNVHSREKGDIVLCPVCQSATESSMVDGETDLIEETSMGESPTERHQRSLEKYKSLPETSSELRNQPTKKKKISKLRTICSSWNEAVSFCVGFSQNVRRDKWWSHTERGAYHFVKGCLVQGVDVNMTNEYGQTALFISAWRGYTRIVTLLLDYGADQAICAHGGSTAREASQVKGHLDVLEVLGYSSSGTVDTSSGLRFSGHSTGKPIESRSVTLIEFGKDHPGAGSFFIDGSFDKSSIDGLISLWEEIPVDFSSSKQNISNKLCSERSYFCDTDGQIGQLLANAIRKHMSVSEVEVWPHMRFLHYSQPGSVLAPHIDLCRVDLSGRRSTHTFILYLHDCEVGGETLLLEGMTGNTQNTALARVSPRRGRLLLFPHNCPHKGEEVKSIPKILLRGEVFMSSINNPTAAP